MTSIASNGGRHTTPPSAKSYANAIHSPNVTSSGNSSASTINKPPPTASTAIDRSPRATAAAGNQRSSRNATVNVSNGYRGNHASNDGSRHRSHDAGRRGRGAPAHHRGRSLHTQYQQSWQQLPPATQQPHYANYARPDLGHFQQPTLSPVQYMTPASPHSSFPNQVHHQTYQHYGYNVSPDGHHSTLPPQANYSSSPYIASTYHPLATGEPTIAQTISTTASGVVPAATLGYQGQPILSSGPVGQNVYQYVNTPPVTNQMHNVDQLYAPLQQQSVAITGNATISQNKTEPSKQSDPHQPVLLQQTLPGAQQSSAKSFKNALSAKHATKLSPQNHTKTASQTKQTLQQPPVAKDLNNNHASDSQIPPATEPQPQTKLPDQATHQGTVPPTLVEHPQPAGFSYASALQGKGSSKTNLTQSGFIGSQNAPPFNSSTQVPLVRTTQPPESGFSTSDGNAPPASTTYGQLLTPEPYEILTPNSPAILPPTFYEYVPTASPILGFNSAHIHNLAPLGETGFDVREKQKRGKRKPKGKSYQNLVGQDPGGEPMRRQPQQGHPNLVLQMPQMAPVVYQQPTQLPIFMSSQGNGLPEMKMKGKHNLNRKRRVTTMKKIIKNERERKRQEKIEHLAKLINPPEDIPTLPEELIEKIIEMVVSPEDEIEDNLEAQVTSPESDAPGSEVSDPHFTVLQENIVNNLPRQFPAIHSRRFREYCNQVLDASLDSHTIKLIECLKRKQDKQLKAQRDREEARRRNQFGGGNFKTQPDFKKSIVMGLREVTKHARAGNLKIAVVAPNLEKVESKGGLDDAVEKLKAACELIQPGLGKNEPTPIAFALSRIALGRALNRSVPISAIGIKSVVGFEKEYKKVIELLDASKDRYTSLCDRYLNFVRTHLQTNEMEEDGDGPLPDIDAIESIITTDTQTVPSQQRTDQSCASTILSADGATKPMSHHNHQSSLSSHASTTHPLPQSRSSGTTFVEPARESSIGPKVDFQATAKQQAPASKPAAPAPAMTKSKFKKGHARNDSALTQVSLISNPISTIGSNEDGRNWQEMMKKDETGVAVSPSCGTKSRSTSNAGTSDRTRAWIATLHEKQ